MRCTNEAAGDIIFDRGSEKGGLLRDKADPTKIVINMLTTTPAFESIEWTTIDRSLMPTVSAINKCCTKAEGC